MANLPLLAALSRLARNAPRARSMRAVVVAIACTLVALWSSPARAHVESQVLTARLTMPSVSVAHREDSRLGLRPTFAYYTRRDATPSQRLLSENPRLRLRLAEDPLLLTIDEYAEHDPRSTLWGWPGQNPIRWSDPSGRRPGDPYASPDAAARAAQFDYTWISVSQNIELSSSIYSTRDAAGNTIFSYTPAETEYKPHESEAKNPIPSGSKLAAHFHTHPGGAPADEKFSTGDKAVCSQEHRPEYLATPKGNLLRYNTNVPWSQALEIGDDSFVSRELGNDVRNVGSNPLLMLAPFNNDVGLDAAWFALNRPRSSSP